VLFALPSRSWRLRSQQLLRWAPRRTTVRVRSGLLQRKRAGLRVRLGGQAAATASTPASTAMDSITTRAGITSAVREVRVGRCRGSADTVDQSMSGPCALARGRPQNPPAFDFVRAREVSLAEPWTPGNRCLLGECAAQCLRSAKPYGAVKSTTGPGCRWLARVQPRPSPGARAGRSTFLRLHFPFARSDLALRESLTFGSPTGNRLDRFFSRAQ
jgi:hypothetical protein